MKGAIAVLVLGLAAVVLARPNEKYTDRWDGINLDEILDNQKLTLSYADCVLEKGRCTPEGKEMKSHIVEGLQTKCAKCTDTQKAGSKKVISAMIHKYPELWAKLIALYDPDNKFASMYEQELKEAKH